MQSLGITQTGPNSFRIDGFPDGVKAIEVDGVLARRFADLALHRSDLEFARLCLDATEQFPASEPQELIRTALWRSAVIHYAKCFGNSKQRIPTRPYASAQRLPAGDPSGIRVLQIPTQQAHHS